MSTGSIVRDCACAGLCCYVSNELMHKCDSTSVVSVIFTIGMIFLHGYTSNVALSDEALKVARCKICAHLRGLKHHFVHQLLESCQLKHKCSNLLYVSSVSHPHTEFF